MRYLLQSRGQMCNITSGPINGRRSYVCAHGEETMFRPKGTISVILVVVLAVGCATTNHLMKAAEEASQSDREAMYYRYLEFPSLVKGGSIQPHWMADGSSFWYAEGSPENTIIYKVHPKANTKSPLFDTALLRQSLIPLLGREPPYQGLPFDDFTFVDDGEGTVQFTVENNDFILQLDSYTITRAATLSEAEKKRLVPQAVRKGLFSHWSPVMEALSPDGHWFAGTKDHNLWLRPTSDGPSVQITGDGIKDYEWDVEGLKWSPNSLKLATTKIDYRKVPKIPIVHWIMPTEEVEWVHWRKAGRPLPQTELYVVDILSKQRVRVDIGEELDQYVEIIGWHPAGSELYFLRTNRTLKRMYIMAANPTSGATRVILTETQKTFIIGLWVYYVGWNEWIRPFTLLQDGTRMTDIVPFGLNIVSSPCAQTYDLRPLIGPLVMIHIFSVSKLIRL